MRHDRLAVAMRFVHDRPDFVHRHHAAHVTVISHANKGARVGYSVVNVEEIEGEGPGGAVRFVRRKLGVQAFGINWFDLGPNVRGREHNEVDTGQEEVNVIIEGSGVYEVDGKRIPVRAGSFLRFDPGTTRCPVAGPEGMTMIAVGVRPGSYEPHGPF